MEAAKRKTFWLCWIASAILLSLPALASSADVYHLKTRAELSAEDGQSGVEPSPFYLGKHVENYDGGWGIASESSVAPKRTVIDIGGEGRVEVAKANGLKVQIGLLPYDYPEELSSWLSNADWEESTIAINDNGTQSVEITIGQNEVNSPLWFMLKNGVPKLVGRGAVSDQDVRAFLLKVQRQTT